MGKVTITPKGSKYVITGPAAEGISTGKLTRPTKLSAGMAKTIWERKIRSGRFCNPNISNEALSSSVRGTTDELGSGIWMYRKPIKVKVKYELSDRGRDKLARLKRKSLTR